MVEALAKALRESFHTFGLFAREPFHNLANTLPCRTDRGVTRGKVPPPRAAGGDFLENLSTCVPNHLPLRALPPRPTSSTLVCAPSGWSPIQSGRLESLPPAHCTAR